MEERLVKVLCKLIELSHDYYTNMANSTVIVDEFLRESQLALSPDGRQQLIDKFNEVY